MENYHQYLPYFKLMPLFQGIEDNQIMDLVEAMQPAVSRQRKGEAPPQVDFSQGYFQVCIRQYPALEVEAKPSKYTMPKVGEPGMMMAEIPALSKAKLPKDFFGPKPGQKPIHPPRDVDEDCLVMTGEMVVKFYSAELYPAQAKMIKNFFGILTQKITDIRAAHRAQVEKLQAQIDAK